MYVASAIAFLTLFGGVEPLLLKSQTDGIQTPPPLIAQQSGIYQHSQNEQQTLDNDSGLRGLKAERQTPELQTLPQQQQLPFLAQSPSNPTLAYVIIKPIQQQWFPDNLGYDRQPMYQQPSYLPNFRETSEDAGTKNPPGKGYPHPPPPPPPPQPQPQPQPQPDDYPAQEPHDYLQEIHAKKQSKLSKLKQHIDRVFQKFASHSSYEIDDSHSHPPPLHPTSAPDAQHPVQTPDQEPEPQQVQAVPVLKEEKGQTKQVPIEEPKEIKEHREGDLKKEPIRAQQVVASSSSHVDDGFSKRQITN